MIATERAAQPADRVGTRWTEGAIGPARKLRRPNPDHASVPGSPAICAGRGSRHSLRRNHRSAWPSADDNLRQQSSLRRFRSGADKLLFELQHRASIHHSSRYRFTAAVQVNESGALSSEWYWDLIALAAGDNGSLDVSSLTTNSSGIATDSQFQIRAPGKDNARRDTAHHGFRNQTGGHSSCDEHRHQCHAIPGVQVTLGATLFRPHLWSMESPTPRRSRWPGLSARNTHCR